MRLNKAHILFGCIAALPLLLLALWAYVSAFPFQYPTVDELLLDPYSSAADALPEAFMRIRQLGVLIYICVLLVVMLRGVRTRSQAVLCGVLASAISTLPVIVPMVLQGEAIILSLLALLLAGVAVFGLRALAIRGPATAAPMTAITMIAGLLFGIQSAAEVALRSNPPLFVLANAARSPESLQAQLALGMHLLYIGGDEEAQPIILNVGEKLVEQYTDSGDDDLLAVAKELVIWARETEANRAVTMPAQQTE
jgi:hypothetical protein